MVQRQFIKRTDNFKINLTYPEQLMKLKLYSLERKEISNHISLEND